MIDIYELRQNPQAYQDACNKKGIALDINNFLQLDKLYREAKTEAESMRSQQNNFSKDISKLSGEEKNKKLAEMKTIAEELKKKGEELKKLEEGWNKALLLIPGIPLESVPTGKSDKDNLEIKKWGEIPKFSFQTKDHVALGQALDIIDIERGVKLSGTRHYFLKGDGARLQHAVLNFAMDYMHSKGYLIMDPPHIVRYQAMMGTSYFPGGEEQAYRLDESEDDLYLIGTAEVSVCSYHCDEILKLEELPKRYAGYSPCYRREAGTYGKDTQGLYRIHQFYKVEQVIICEASKEESERLHKELLENAESIMQALGVPYRVVINCSADLGRGQVFKNDIEAWMPSRNGYGETHSCSSFYDYQARRLNLRYKDKSGKNTICYTLNNTLIASPRILISLLELNQNADGSVTIPAVLRPYMKNQERISK